MKASSAMSSQNASANPLSSLFDSKQSSKNGNQDAALQSSF